MPVEGGGLSSELPSPLEESLLLLRRGRGIYPPLCGLAAGAQVRGLAAGTQVRGLDRGQPKAGDRGALRRRCPGLAARPGFAAQRPRGAWQSWAGRGGSSTR